MGIQWFDAVAAKFFQPIPMANPPRFGMYCDASGAICFAVNGVKQFTISGATTGSSRLVQTGNRAPASATDGTDVTPVVTEAYVCEIYVPHGRTPNGVSILNGSAVAGNVQASLYDSSGNKAAQTASTAQSGTGAYQRIPWAAAPRLSNGTYYLVLQFNNTGARFRAHAFGDFGAGKLTGLTYGTPPVNPTLPSTFTASLGPVASLY